MQSFSLKHRPKMKNPRVHAPDVVVVSKVFLVVDGINFWPWKE